MLKRIPKAILKLFGWKLDVVLPKEKKFILIGAPHTSNWDFPLGILYSRAIRLKVQWMGKHTLFRWPYGWFFRAIGGTAVHRESGKNYIVQMTDLFEHSEQLVLALAPEGTRTKTDHWKTGFYYIARAANVPIAMGYLDFGNKQVGIGDLFYPTDDINADFEYIRQFYANRRGKNPEKESLINMRTK
jgi:1-acyl-sn-glycerol-3-phosphate acyltransferase